MSVMYFSYKLEHDSMVCLNWKWFFFFNSTCRNGQCEGLVLLGQQTQYIGQYPLIWPSLSHSPSTFLLNHNLQLIHKEITEAVSSCLTWFTLQFNDLHGSKKKGCGTMSPYLIYFSYKERPCIWSNFTS